MNGQSTDRVIHLVPPNGGGVDRFVRDLVAHRRADWVVHVCEAQAVVEVPSYNDFKPLDLGTFAHLAWAGRLGRPVAVHAHSTTAVVRGVADMLCAALRVPCVLTLHDIGFDDAEAGAAEHEARLHFARAAAVRTAPSRYIIERAQAALGEDVACQGIENGVDPLPVPAPQVDALPRFPVAVIGALGEHKGLVALLEAAGHLSPESRVVILGYTGRQLVPGWTVPDRVWMHGPFQPPELPALVARYGARLAFFPPGIPESYCYALSDAWLAGLPVLAPDHGAIGERVRRHGGGALYDPRLSPAALAELVDAHVGAGDPPTVRHAASALTPVRTMVNALNEIYRLAGSDSERPTPQRDADEIVMRELAQKHLDTRFFRKELLWYQGKLVATEDERDHLRTTLEQERQSWSQRVAALEQALVEAQARLDAELAVLARERDDARARHATLVARITRPLRVLPAPLRDLAIRLGKRLLP